MIAIEEHDALIIYCPQLGGEIPFRYCRTVNEDLPCRKIIVCWEFRIEIGKFLERTLFVGPNPTCLGTSFQDENRDPHRAHRKSQKNKRRRGVIGC